MNTRKQIRLQNYDYSNNGAYFVTICTKERKCVLGTIPKTQNICVGQGLCSCRLSDIGIVVDEEIRNLTSRYKYIEIQKYVIMPNHLHMIISINNPPIRQEQSPCPTISDIICTLKSITTKRINKQRNTPGKKIWQSRFHDHVIRNENDYLQILQYIENNPFQWELDKYFIK